MIENIISFYYVTEKIKMARKTVSKENEMEVLTQSRRRCSICFGLDKDFNVKKGQIAHIDHNNENADFENLAFLCLLHHDEYDSKTSQSKGFKSEELKLYRKRLYEFVMNWKSYSHTSESNLYPDINLGNNKFKLYKLFNTDSSCGYNYLAFNKTKQVYFSISDNHFTISPFYWEVSQWLNCDYQETQIYFEFDLIKLSEFISDYLFESNYTLTACINKQNQIESIDFTFNETHRYYELEYSIVNKKLKKTADRHDTYFDLKDVTNRDIVIFTEIRKQLKEFLNFRLALFS